MIEVEMDATALARTRLALSPVADALGYLMHTLSRRPDSLLDVPGPAARAATRHPDVAVLAAVLPRGGSGYTPDFLTPKPLGNNDSFRTQVELIETAPPEVIHRQIALERFHGAPLPPAVQHHLGRGTFGSLAARALDTFWRAALRDEWSTLHQQLEADVAQRDRVLGRGGVAALLSTLHRDVSHDGRTLQVRIPPWNERGQLVDTELVVSPSLFGWPAISAQLCNADQAVLRYPLPPRPAPNSSTRDAVAALIGPTRAVLLADLGVRRSTRALSERHHLSPATVSYHLGVLHDCALLHRERDGHTVYYWRTVRADLLID